MVARRDPGTGESGPLAPLGVCDRPPQRAVDAGAALGRRPDPRRSACADHGLHLGRSLRADRLEAETVDVLVPLGARRNSKSPVAFRVHRRREWDGVRVHRDGWHHPADAVLLAAATFDSPRPACGLLAAAVQQRVVRPDEFSAAIDRAARIRHRAVLRSAVADIAQGSDALSEIDLVRLCRRAGLPAPTQQTVRRERGGRRRYLDASWRRRDGRLVVVEVDGALHLSPRRWWDDQLRQNEITLGDALVLRFPSVVVRTQPELVAAQLRRALLL